MQNSNLKIKNRNFLKYKFFNSLFLGISVGSIFIIYTPLEPSIYSIGGILLAFAMLFIAKLYTKILTIKYFYKISLFVEFIILLSILIFLIFSYSYQTALFIYAGYQLTFAFGSYLIRAETLFLKRRTILTFVDVAKQKGYLIGMVISYLFYKTLENVFEITNHQIQVYNLHFLLVIIETCIILLLIQSFKQDKKLYEAKINFPL
jgi:hypothetical protein